MSSIMWKTFIIGIFKQYFFETVQLSFRYDFVLLLDEQTSGCLSYNTCSSSLERLNKSVVSISLNSMTHVHIVVWLGLDKKRGLG